MPLKQNNNLASFPQNSAKKSTHNKSMHRERRARSTNKWWETGSVVHCSPRHGYWVIAFIYTFFKIKE